MDFKHFDPTALAPWSALQDSASAMASTRILDLFDDKRVEQCSLDCAGVSLDYSKNLVDKTVLEQLVALAEASPLAEHRAAMFAGESINVTEQRPVLHSALRSSADVLARRGTAELADPIQEQLDKMAALSGSIRDGSWTGATGKEITDVVNIGIGGSDLGPRMAYEALKEYSAADLNCHFIANVDGEPILSLLRRLDPETTLFVICSKTFTTQETLMNAHTAAKWLGDALSLNKPFSSPHFMGITSSPEAANALGIPNSRLLSFWDWVGGRYSLWSTIGFSVCVAVGMEHFRELLDGAATMDQHFIDAPLSQNMPVILALLGIWYGNFLGAESYAVIPYCERLKELPLYLQQLDMESNGKSVAIDGSPIEFDTGPIVWGTTGTNGQHSFFQLLHQGSHCVPVDFIGVVKDSMNQADHHRALLGNMLAQSAALMSGRQDDSLPAHRQYAGNRPSNTLLLDELTPYTLGALIALYEHKVFVQGSIWGINSFDQWGVELGKSMASELLADDCDTNALDASTRSLLQKTGLQNVKS